jgi:hypothetical protein
VLLALAVLVGLSLHERSGALYASYWIDEGIALGIAQHSLDEIPGVLRKDGSPPFYYLLLHVWIDLFGTRELATHWLSLACAALTIPAAYWAASAWGRGPGLAAAVLVTLTPFLDSHATETRMYALVALLAVLACGAFVRGFVQRRRRFVVVFALLAAALLYTHNWALFLGLGAGVAIAALALVRRDAGVLRDGALAGAGALLLYAPWIPTLLHQASHTGAPWAAEPPLRALIDEVPHALLGPRDLVVWLALLVAVGGAALVVRRGPAVEREALLALALVLVTCVVAAFVAAQIEPGWASRYFAVFLAPLVVLLGLGVARARWAGLAALVVIALLSYNPVTPSPYFKTNAEAVANEVNPRLRAGDLVLSSQAETVPLLHHYLRGRLSYADPMRRVGDPRTMDWTDVTAKLRDAPQPAAIEPLLAGVRPGQRLVLVRPIVRGLFGWTAPWTRLVRIRSDEIERALARDPRFRSLGTFDGSTPTRSRRVGVTATVYERRDL